MVKGDVGTKTGTIILQSYVVQYRYLTKQRPFFADHLPGTVLKPSAIFIISHALSNEGTGLHF
ncbi:hypothetical protein D3C86_1805040 [compost metagenome]